MKWSSPIVLFIAAALGNPSAMSLDIRSASMTNRFRVHGMHCDGCAKGIRSELNRIPGVVDSQVSLTDRTTIVRFDSNRVSTVKLKRAIENAGYKAELDQQ